MMRFSHLFVLVFMLGLLFCSCNNMSGGKKHENSIDLAEPVLSVKAVDVDQVELFWNLIEKANEYEIYISEDDEDFRYYISTAENYINLDCSDYSKEYFYKIRAKEKTKKVFSDFSNTESICLADEASLEITHLFALYGDNSSILLNWKQLKSADSYNLYYGLSSNVQDMELITNTAEACYIFTNCDKNTTYYFCVKAIIKDEEKGESNIADYTLAKYLPMVENLKGYVVNITNNGLKYAKIHLSWDKVDDAEWYVVSSITHAGLISSVFTNSFDAETPQFSSKDPFSEDPAYEKKKFVFSVTPCGTGKYIQEATTILINLSDSEYEDGTADSIIGLRVEESPAYPLILRWNKIDGIQKYRLYYSYKEVNYDTPFYEDIEDTCYKFHGAFNSIYYFWMKPLTEDDSFPVSSPIYGIIPKATSYEIDKEQISNYSTKPSQKSNSKYSYSYYMAQFNLQWSRYETYIIKAYQRKAMGDHAGYSVYIGIANSARADAERFLRMAKQSI